MLRKDRADGTVVAIRATSPGRDPRHLSKSLNKWILSPEEAIQDLKLAK